MAKYQVWMQACVVDGEEYPANYCGEYEAESFAAACEMWVNLAEVQSHFDREMLTVNGLGLFDSEDAANG